MRIVAVVFGVAVVGTAMAVLGGTLLWNRATARTVRRLTELQRVDGDGRRFALSQLAGLPPPVSRYFAFALPDGQPVVRRARVRHTGDFQSRPGDWRAFISEQHYTVQPPGFVWDASIQMVWPLSVRVRDSYVDGEGAMRARVAALVPVVDQRGTPELASGALMRYLAEAVWFPTALLSQGDLTWTAIDDSTARATLRDHGTSVSVDFHFGSLGEVVRISALRYRDVSGRPVLTPWVGQFFTYERVRGAMIPLEAEVAWMLPEGPAPYWRGRIVDVAYAFDPDAGAASAPVATRR